MNNIKRIFFMVAIVIALVLSSCSSHKHKNYIPGDSKVVGKIDIKEFFKQSEIDHDKLIKDITDAFGDDVTLDDCGIDITEPMYIFANGKGVKINLGMIIKIDDRKKAKSWADDNFKISIDKKTEGYDYATMNSFAVGVNDDVLVLVKVSDGDETDAKKALRSIMNKDSKVDIGDNELFKKMDDAESFACLYADMSIIPDEMLQVSGMDDEIKTQLADFRKITIGVDATLNDKICDFGFWSSSTDENVQKKIDEKKELFKSVSDKAVQMLPEDALFGFVTNLNGKQYASMLEKALKSLGFNEVPTFQSVVDIISKINGNIVGFSDLSMMPSATGAPVGKMCYVIEGGDFCDEIANFFGGFSENAQTGSDSLMDESFSFTKSDNGYNYNNEFWFGYSNGAMWFTTQQGLAGKVFEKAEKPISSNLTDFIKDHHFTLFINLSSAEKKFAEVIDEMPADEQKKLKAFSEIFDKIQYVTYSMK